MFDNFVSKIVVILVFLFLLGGIFFIYSPRSSDKVYIDFFNQVKILREVVAYNRMGLVNDQKEILEKLSLNFKIVDLKGEKFPISLISAYDTAIYLFYDYFSVQTVSDKSFVPLKVIIDIDSILDDGIPVSGYITSQEGKYFVGCNLIIK